VVVVVKSAIFHPVLRSVFLEATICWPILRHGMLCCFLSCCAPHYSTYCTFYIYNYICICILDFQYVNINIHHCDGMVKSQYLMSYTFLCLHTVR
jgi:hypothetical protein